MSISGGEPGDLEADASQHFHFLGILIDDSEAEDATGLELRVDASDLVIPNPVFRFYVEHVGTQRGPGPASGYALVMNETSFPELGRHLGADRTTIEHRVRLLAKTRFVTVTRGGRSTFAFLPGQELDPALRRGQSQVAQTLLRILRDHGGAMPRNALHAAAPTHSPRTRNGALTRLITTGAIERAIEGSVEIVRLKR